MLSSLFITSTAQAGSPLWTFIPNGSTAVTMNALETVTVKYTVSNNSNKTHHVVLSSNTPNGITQTSPCTLAPRGSVHSTCLLTLSISGSALPSNHVSGGPVLCEAQSDGRPNMNQCYQPSFGDTLVITRLTSPETAILSITPSTLGLSVNNSPLNAALTGNARNITITNTGPKEATGLSITYPIWPGGIPATTATSTCSGTLAPAATCTITITPGSNATSNCNTGIEPRVSDTTITVNAANAVAPVTT